MADSLMLNVGGKLVPTTSTALAGKSLPPASRPKRSSLLHRLSIRDAALADSSSGCFTVEMEPHLFEPLLGFLKGNGLPLAFGRHKARLLEAAIKLGLEKRVMEREWAAKTRRVAEEVKESDGGTPAALASARIGDHASLKDVLTALGDLQNDRAKVFTPSEYQVSGKNGTLKRELDPSARSTEARKRSNHCDCASGSVRRDTMAEMQRSQRIASLQSQLVQSEVVNARLRDEVCNFQESQRRFQTCVDRKSHIFDTIHQQYKRACQEREEYLRRQMELLEQRSEKLAQLSNNPLMMDASTSPPLTFSDTAKSHTVQPSHWDRRPPEDVRASMPILSVLMAEKMSTVPEIFGVLPSNHSEGLFRNGRMYGAVEVEKKRQEIFRDMEFSFETKTKTSEELYMHTPKRPYPIMERTLEGQCGFGFPLAKRGFRSRNRSTIQVSSKSENNYHQRQLENVPLVPLCALATFACLISPDVSEPQACPPVTRAENDNGHMHFRNRSHPSIQTYNLHLPHILPHSRSPPMGTPIAPCFERFRMDSSS